MGLFIRPKADLLYGAGKTTKTSNIGKMARYVFEKYGKLTRLLTVDGGGYDTCMAEVEAGLIIPWCPLARPRFTISTLDLACQGYWPKDAQDPLSPLQPPGPGTWEMIGAYGVEGLTSIGDGIIRQLKKDKAHLSQDPSYTYSEQAVEVEINGIVKPLSISYSGGNMSYYGAAQDQIYDMILKTHLLPVEKVLWTALEGKGEEEGTRAPIYGPAIVGKKSTGKAPQWFGNCLHIEQLVEQVADEKTKQMRVIERPVMYIRTHADPLSRVPFPAGTRIPHQFAKDIPDFMEPDIAAFYRMVDEVNEKALAQAMEFKQRVQVAMAGRTSAATEPQESKAPIEVAAPQQATVPTPKGAEVPVPAVTPIASAPQGNGATVVPVAPAAPVVAKPMFVPPRISVKKPV